MNSEEARIARNTWPTEKQLPSIQISTWMSSLFKLAGHALHNMVRISIWHSCIYAVTISEN